MKVFRNTPLIVLRPGKHMINDPSGADPVCFLAGDICRSQKCLYRMHICIESAVIIQFRKFRIPGIT